MRKRNSLRLGALILLLGLFMCVVAISPAFARDNLNCADFNNQVAAQAVLDKDKGDPDHLDRDGDGTACKAFFATEDSSAAQDNSNNSGTGSGGDFNVATTDSSGDSLASLTCEQLIRLEERQYDADDGQYANERQLIAELSQKCEGKASSGLIPGSVPNGTLADTGGIPLIPGILAFGIVLIGAGLLLRASLHRER